MTYNFPIIIEECEEGGYFGECPQIPGCHVEGETFNETLAELRAAIAGMIADYKECGDPLPVGYPFLSVVAVED